MGPYMMSLNGRRKFLITGGAGFIGSHLCRHFLDYKVDESGLFASGNNTICVGNLSRGNGNISDLMTKPGFYTIPVLNRFKQNAPWENVVDEIGYVLHFASYPSPKDHLAMPLETLIADSEGTIEMINLAHAKKATFMLASTGHIDQENDPTQERSVYCEGKRFGEAYTMAAHRKLGLETRIIRMFNSYGPGMRIDDGRVIPTFIVKALKDETLSINGGEQLISLTYIDDMVDGIDRILFSDVVEPVEIGSPYRISIGDLAQKIIKLSGSHSKLNLNPQTAKDERLPNLQRANELGWSPKVDIEEGLKRTINYFREKL
jgi:dTDP-glucose 4,6-dehydratase